MDTNSKTQVKVPVNGNLIRVHLDVVNGINNLTVRERDILSLFIQKGKQAFSISNKREITKQAGLKSVDALNVYVKLLKDKKVIIPDPKSGYRFNPLVIPNPNGLSIEYIL